MGTKKFTILHSNDMHGDFLAQMAEGKSELVGGLALLSGYVNRVREEEENVLYVIAGDMLQGSLIDTEFKGVSTFEIMNYLSPDVVALGNHEVDYGLPHLLFLDKITTFPIVNANLFIRKNQRRLMLPYLVLEKAGFSILFTGILTDKAMDAISQDSLIGSFVDVEDAAAAVGRITNAYKGDDIDLTIVLTHIGFDSDKELAGLLDPAWGVDMIIGGHSHTILEQPAQVNGVLIAQAGVGTDQIGRFDIEVDDETNAIIGHTWQLVRIEPGIAEPDQQLLDYIESFKKVVDDKYNALLTSFSRTLTHPAREVETELGNAFADTMMGAADSDVLLLGAGSIRVDKLGPAVSLGDFISAFPYDDTLKRYTISGETLLRTFGHIMRNENRDGEGECYQVNAGVRAVFDTGANKLVSLSLGGTPVDPAGQYRICVQGYHAMNAQEYLAIPSEELEKLAPMKVVATSAQGVLHERLADTQNLDVKVEGRLEYR
jgi:5'-nucleotidase